MERTFTEEQVKDFLIKLTSYKHGAIINGIGFKGNQLWDVFEKGYNIGDLIEYDNFITLDKSSDYVDWDLISEYKTFYKTLSEGFKLDADVLDPTDFIALLK